MPLPGDNANDRVEEHVLTLAAGGLPLSTGLRAAAAETNQRRVGRSLRELADALDAGQPLEAALAKAGSRLPGNLAMLVKATKRSGRLQEALFDLVEHDLATQEALRTAYSALAYPVALLLFSYSLFVFLQWFVMGGMFQLYQEFELALPRTTLLVGYLHRIGIWLVVVPLAMLAVAAIVAAVLKKSQRQRVIAVIPFFGSMFHWVGVSQATRRLAHLVKQEVPLAEALRLSAEGLRDANVADVWRMLAAQVEAGQPLSDSLLGTYRIPASVAPLVHWGELTQNLPQALLTASDMLEGRVRLRAQMIRIVLPPIFLIVIGGGAFFMVGAMFVPLIALIQNLSG
jgi:type II secretory pathway component PulF